MSNSLRYVVFETLNSPRGKNLDVADLLKNLLLAKLKVKNTSADSPRQKWDVMRSAFESTDVTVNVDRFILHWWLSQEKYVAQRKLFRAIKKSVTTKPLAQDRLDSLAADAPLYLAIADPTSRKWEKEEAEMAQALEALMLFNVIQPGPLLLALMRERRDKGMSMKQIRLTFQAVERYHYQHNAISQLSSSGGVSARYASYARDISLGGSTNKKAIAAGDLRSVLAKGAPDPAVFDAAFSELIFTDDYTREKKIIQYTLRRVHESTNLHRPSQPTLEHLSPQAAIGKGSSTQSVVGNIGNLIYLDDKLNRLLNSKSFPEKQKILASHKASYDIDDILAATSWGALEIQKRAQRLAELARTTVWKIPK